VPSSIDADDDVLDVVLGGQEPLAADQVLLGVLLDVRAAGIGVVLLQRRDHVVEREVEAGQVIGTDLDLVGLELAAEGVDLDHAGHAAQPRRDLPLEDRAQLHRKGVWWSAAALRTGWPELANLELEDLAEAGRDRAHLGLAVAGWNRFRAAARRSPICWRAK
jgi:hypothetical protein